MAEVSRRRSGNLLEDTWRDVEDVFRRAFAPYAEGGGPRKATAWSPRVDVAENETAYVVKADLPGVDPNDVEITIHDGILTIQGERKEEHEEKGKKYYKIERSVGTFFREVPLPGAVDADGVTAETSHGVITVTVPKKPGSQPKKIPLKPSA